MRYLQEGVGREVEEHSSEEIHLREGIPEVEIGEEQPGDRSEGQGDSQQKGPSPSPRRLETVRQDSHGRVHEGIPEGADGEHGACEGGVQLHHIGVEEHPKGVEEGEDHRVGAFCHAIPGLHANGDRLGALHSIERIRRRAL
jgi:hypothetical protein